MRKRLGSSSFAVASTLEKTADRLEAEAYAGKRRNDAGGFLADPDVEADLKEAVEFQTDTSELITSNERQDILAEVKELREYAQLARSIHVNQKAVKLVEALSQGFEKLREIGAPEKAIIFTDSTVTQDYIAETLREAGWGDGLVLFNGTNNSPEANEIYQQWLAENKGSDLITGIPAADRRKALVDEFRERGKLMIATEAAAEGINLQFCSMLVNYDLPWNPQRVEQRIGRVHRFGQKHNVIVVNFSNKGNKAEERILELLSEKFQLFTSVFGASDEVLGQIEDGLDFERNIVNILERCKTAAEIDAAFNELELKYAKQIDREMQKTRARVFDNLDPKVQDKLKSYDAQAGVVLNAFERLLLAVTRHELQILANFNEAGTQFTLHEAPQAGIPTGDYFFKSAPRKGAHQYRYSSDLCQWVIGQAKTGETPDAQLTFSLSGSQRATAIAKKLKGKSGSLSISLVSFSMSAGKQDLTESYLLMAGATDSGEKLDQEQIRDLLDLTCINAAPTTVDADNLKDELDTMQATLTYEVTERNSNYLIQQEAIIDAERRDQQATYFAKIKELEGKENTALKAVRKAADTVSKLKLTKEARKLRSKIEDLEDEYRQVRNRLRKQSDEQLALAAEALRPTQKREQLFTINWQVLD